MSSWRSLLRCGAVAVAIAAAGFLQAPAWATAGHRISGEARATTARGAASPAAGGYHTCAIRKDHSLWCWGLNDDGQLGTGNTINADTPQRVGTRSNWKAVSAGQYHTCAVRTSGTLWCWGYNYDGELGTGSTISADTPQRVGTRSNWKAVSAGGFHTCAVRTGGTLWCWGLNNNGELGTGNIISADTPRRVGTGAFPLFWTPN